MLVVLLGHCVKPQRKMHALSSPCVVKGHMCLGRTQTRESGNVGVKRRGCVCFAKPRTPPENAGTAGVISDTRDRPSEIITKLFRFLYKPASGWTDRFGVAWPLGDPDGRSDLERAAAREQAMLDVVNIDKDERRERIQLGIILTAVSVGVMWYMVQNHVEPLPRLTILPSFLLGAAETASGVIGL
eukprot:jgi/Botrbrau1/13914/Bobra.136_2s0007.1